MKKYIENLKQNRKKSYISGLALLLLVVMLVASTYAFFKSTDATDEDFPLEVTTNTTDSLVFNVTNDISFTASPANFNEGMGNQEGVTTASATLKANNKTNSATEHYYLYLDITKNELKYTTESNKPELILQVTDPNGNTLNSINGLEYKTVVDGKGESISGFDITTNKDLITIADNYEITTTSEKKDNWNIKVILVNLSDDQNINGGKAFNGSILFTKEDIRYTVIKSISEDFEVVPSYGILEYTGSDELWKNSRKIKKVIFENRIKEYENASYTLNIAEEGNLPIMVYLIDNGDETYTTYIQSDVKIKANQNSSFLFCNFEILESIDGLENLDTTEVTDMLYMFAECKKLASLNLSNFDTSKVIFMERMFSGCSKLTSLDLSNFDTSQVKYIENMFYNCSNLTSLDFKNATFNSITEMENMFTLVPSSIEVIVKDDAAKTFIEARLNEANGGTVTIA